MAIRLRGGPSGEVGGRSATPEPDRSEGGDLRIGRLDADEIVDAGDVEDPAGHRGHGPEGELPARLPESDRRGGDDPEPGRVEEIELGQVERDVGRPVDHRGQHAGELGRGRQVELAAHGDDDLVGSDADGNAEVADGTVGDGQRRSRHVAPTGSSCG